jgi:hypothetical protein
MGIIVRQYGLNILTSVVGTSPRKYHFRDEAEARWAAHMADTLLRLKGQIVLNPHEGDDGSYWTVTVAVNLHDYRSLGSGRIDLRTPTYEFRGWMLRLEYQDNLKHLFEEQPDGTDDGDRDTYIRRGAV